MHRHALRALLDTFSTHADVGLVGAKLVGHNDTLQEAGAILWSGGTGAWFLKNSQLRRGRANEGNHRLNYVRETGPNPNHNSNSNPNSNPNPNPNPNPNQVRETDYVSAACALVPRALFLRHGMFDLHFSPGYYEDTDLAFTVRAAGLRVLYQPFAHVVHQSHTTYAAGDGGEAKMDTLIDRNRQHFTSKWGNSMPHRPRTPDQ